MVGQGGIQAARARPQEPDQEYQEAKRPAREHQLCRLAASVHDNLRPIRAHGGAAAKGPGGSGEAHLVDFTVVGARLRDLAAQEGNSAHFDAGPGGGRRGALLANAPSLVAVHHRHRLCLSLKDTS